MTRADDKISMYDNSTSGEESPKARWPAQAAVHGRGPSLGVDSGNTLVKSRSCAPPAAHRRMGGILMIDQGHMGIGARAPANVVMARWKAFVNALTGSSPTRFERTGRFQPPPRSEFTA